MNKQYNKVKVLYIDKSNNLGGAEISMKELVTHLHDQLDHPIICFNYPIPYHSIHEDTKAKIIFRTTKIRWWMTEKWRWRIKGFGILERLGFAFILSRIIRKYKPQIMHINLYRAKDYLDLVIARMYGVVTILHVRSLDNQVPLNKGTLNKCDMAICVSDAVKKELESIGATCKIERIYDGIEFSKCQSESNQAEARRFLGLPKNAKILSSIAVLWPRKGHDTAIRSLALIKPDIPETILLIAGGEPPGLNGSEINRLKNIAAESDIADSVIFLGHCSEMNVVFAASDVVYALSSDGEAFGRVPAESAIARRPVIATAIGATPELVVHNKTGFLVKPDDIKAIAHYSINLFKNPKRYESFTAQAETRARKMFNWRFSSKQFEKAYQNLIFNNKYKS